MTGVIEVLSLVWSVVSVTITFFFYHTALGKWLTHKSKPVLAALGLEIPESPRPPNPGAVDAALIILREIREENRMIRSLLEELKGEHVRHHGGTHARQSEVAAAIVPEIHGASAGDREHTRSLAREDREFIRELNRRRGRDLGLHAVVDLGVDRILRELPQSLRRGENPEFRGCRNSA